MSTYTGTTSSTHVARAWVIVVGIVAAAAIALVLALTAGTTTPAARPIPVATVVPASGLAHLSPNGQLSHNLYCPQCGG